MMILAENEAVTICSRAVGDDLLVVGEERRLVLFCGLFAVATGFFRQRSRNVVTGDSLGAGGKRWDSETCHTDLSPLLRNDAALWVFGVEHSHPF